MKFPDDFEFIAVNPREKTPAFDGWRTAQALTREQVLERLAQGGNYGVRLRACDLVVDIDPRNGGDESMLGFDTSKFPTVLTPSGGKHLYMRKPPDFKIHHTVKKLFPGIEFKTKGRQVVGPGSIHPNGKRYEFEDIFAPPFGPDGAPDLPEVLAVRIKMENVIPSGGGIWTDEQLETVLAHLDPEKHSDHDQWLAIMMASHEATGGLGEDEFVQWSLRDTKYHAHENVIRARWQSLQSGKAGNAGPGTLRHLLVQAGVKDIGFDTAAEDFAEFANDELKDVSAKIHLRIRGGSLPQNVFDAERELGAATLRNPASGVFQRGGILVRMARLTAATSADGIRRAAGTLQILAVGSDVLRMILTRCVGWASFNQRKKEWTVADAPANVARTLSEAAGMWPNTPPLHGIIEAPALRPDGGVLDTPGYDAGSGLFFDPGSTIFPAIPANPTRADAIRALERLSSILKDFPFVDEASRAVALALLITALVRFALRAAPMFVISAPKMASGKTLLAHLPSYIATGRPPALISQSETPDEERKRLLALLIEGSVVTVIDNIERALKSDVLCTALTEPVIRDRLLGSTRTVSAPTSTTWVATGNNVQINGDLTSRCLLCRLDPECERPEERTFLVNLHELVPAERGALAAAALTIVRAYAIAGFPSVNVPTFGRFEDWSRFVRSPLVWLGTADPCETRRAIEVRDPIRDSLGNLLQAWLRCFGDAPETATQAVHLVQSSFTDEYNELRAAIVAVAEEHGHLINARRFGQFIAHHERRIERGLRFERFGDRQRVALWRVRHEL